MEELPTLLPFPPPQSPLAAAASAVGGATAAAAAAVGGAAAAARVPVTIVTGFLGAGKTTLLRHVLTALHGRRVAVIENEFADEMGIESLILKDGLAGPAADGFYELQNGCLCCTTRDDLVVVLEKIMARSREKRFDCVLIETSGLANPGPVAAAFWSDVGDLDAQLELDAVVTVVDAAHVLRQLDGAGGAAAGRREAEQQIACADVVLLNKCDLVAGAGERAAIRRRLHGMNAAARLVECERASVAMDVIMGLRAFDVTRASAAAQGILHSASAAAALASRAASAPAAAITVTAPTAGHEHAACVEAGCSGVHDDGGALVGGAGGALGCAHDEAIRTVVLRCGAPLNARRFTRWIASLLWDDGAAPQAPGAAPLAAGAAPPLQRPEVLRGKGVLCVQAGSLDGDGASEAAAAVGAGSGAPRAQCSPLRHIFQSVQEQFDLQPAQGEGARWADAELPAESRLVLIGRALDVAALGRGFSACADENGLAPTTDL
jgi:G3E family GTPase